MKKLLLSLFTVIACGIMFTSCENKATGMIEFGISDGTATGLSHDNYGGLHNTYLDAVWNEFIQAGCVEGQHTWSGGLLLTNEMMTKKKLDKFVKRHADDVIERTIREIQEKYPELSPKTDILRFRYSVGDGEQTIYDKQIEI